MPQTSPPTDARLSAALREAADAIDRVWAMISGGSSAPAPPSKPAVADKHPIEMMGPDVAPPDGRVNANEPGIKGAVQDSMKVTIGNAGSFFGAVAMRPVRGDDLQEAVDDARADGTTIRGMDAVKDADGNVVEALIRVGGRTLLCEFLDRRGPLILARAKKAREPFTGPPVMIDPKDRERVLAVLDAMPNAQEEFSFDPFEGLPDPWVTAAETGVDLPPP